MARFEDYVKPQNDELEKEIKDAKSKAEDRKAEPQDGEAFELPDRFKGKSPEDIARSYMELEKAYSRQGNDLGQMRQTLDQFLELESQRSRPPETKEEPDVPVTIDDLYEKPEEVISRVAEKTAGGRIEAIEKQLKEQLAQEKLRAIQGKFPDWQKDVGSVEFQNWVAESPYRQRLAKAADGYDFDAAEEILGLYEETKARGQESEATAKREEDLKAATLESSGAGAPSTEETFSRTNIMQAKIAAKHGNSQARAWLNANSQAIQDAYESGRITD